MRLLKAFFGTQGIWMAVTQKPDVIITDLRMPQGTAHGHRVPEAERADRRHSRHRADRPARARAATRAREIGASSYLTKPIHFNDLLGELLRHIEIRPKPFEEQ